VVEAEKPEELELPNEIKEYMKKHVLTPVDIARIIQWARKVYHKLVEVERERDYYKTLKTALEEGHVHLQDELRGLLTGRFTVKELATKHFLAYASKFHDIDEAYAAAFGKRIFIPWQDILFVASIIAAFTFFYAMRDWLTVPQNQLYFLVLVVLLLGFPYMLGKRGRKIIV